MNADVCNQVVPLHLQGSSLKHPYLRHKDGFLNLTGKTNQLKFLKSECRDVAKGMPENTGIERRQDVQQEVKHLKTSWQSLF